uniref:Origin recognition complex subunit 1 n=1 Tax=Blastobotrys adeninivorans TaxID=409370 RepID=A0A060TFZ7_BLAAD
MADGSCMVFIRLMIRDAPNFTFDRVSVGMSEEEELVYIYDEKQQNRQRRTTRRAPPPEPIAAKRNDGVTFNRGDTVLVASDEEAPYVGIIAQFVNSVKGSIQVKLLWFSRPGDMSPELREKVQAQDRELFVTADSDENDPEVLINPVQVVSKDIWNSLSAEEREKSYFCQRASAGIGFEVGPELDWDKLYKGSETDFEAFQRQVKGYFAPPPEPEPQTPKRGRGRPPKRKIDEDQGPSKRAKLDGDSDEDDEFYDAEDNGLKGEEMEDGEYMEGGEAEPGSDPELDDDDGQEEEEEEDLDLDDEDEEEQRQKKSRSKQSPRKSQGGRKKTPNLKPNVPVHKKTPSPKKRRHQIGTGGGDSKAVRAILPTRSPMKPKGEEVQSVPVSPHKIAREKLHVASVPDSLPCREDEFSQIFLTLESAINAGTGTCVYISGTPGTGKTATVREVIAQLELRSDDGELAPFKFLEINGMKLINPHSSYEMLWEVMTGEKVGSNTAMVALENEFKRFDDNRVPMVVLMDELDQLVTKNQTVMYNFFNWPTFTHSRLIVIAVANTMDLPERMLSNKISSRLGLTRIQFPGYSHTQLKEIIYSRLEGETSALVEKDAVEFAARKIAGVSGDARRALDICRRAVELAEISGSAPQPTVTIENIKQAISETTNSPVAVYVRSLPLAGKVLLCAVIARVRRSGVIDNALADVLEETSRLVRLSPNAEKYTMVLFPQGRVRMEGFLGALTELVEGGILVQQSMRGERSANIRLSANEEDIRTAFKNDTDVQGML